MLSLSFMILCHIFCIPLGDVGHNLLRLITSSTVSPMQTIDFFFPLWTNAAIAWSFRHSDGLL